MNGVSSCGSSLALLVVPPLFQTLISYYQWQGAILILAALVGNISVCGALFRPTALEIKARNGVNTPKTASPQSTKNEPKNKGYKVKFINSVVEAGDLTLFKNAYFVLGCITFFLYGVGFIIPTHYLSSRAKHIGFSDRKAAILVSSIGIGSCVSRLTHGLINDYHILTAGSLTSLSYILCAVANILVPQSDAYPALVTCAVLIGIASGVFHSTFTILAKDYVGLDHISGGLGWLLCMHGLGSIFGSYLTGKSIRLLYDNSPPLSRCWKVFTTLLKLHCRQCGNMCALHHQRTVLILGTITTQKGTWNTTKNHAPISKVLKGMKLYQFHFALCFWGMTAKISDFTTENLVSWLKNFSLCKQKACSGDHEFQFLWHKIFNFVT